MSNSIWPPPPDDFPPKGGLPVTPPASYPPVYRPNPGQAGPSGYPPPAPGPPGPPTQEQPGAFGGGDPGGYPPPTYIPPGYPMPAPGPSAPQPDRPPPGPPPRHRKPRLFTWILLALAAVFLLVAGCTAVGVKLARGPIDAANRYVALLDSGQVPQAYQSLCPATRGVKTQAQFSTDNSAAGRITDYALSGVSTGSGQATQVSGTISVDGTPRSVVFQMTRTSGNWQVCIYPPVQ